MARPQFQGHLSIMVIKARLKFLKNTSSSKNIKPNLETLRKTYRCNQRPQAGGMEMPLKGAVATSAEGRWLKYFLSNSNNMKIIDTLTEVNLYHIN